MGKKNPRLSNRSKAYRMLLKGIPIIKVVIRHDLGFEEVKQYYLEYLSLNGKENLVKFFKDNDSLLPFINRVAEKIKSCELSGSDVSDFIGDLDDIKVMKDAKNKLQHEINMLTIKRNDLIESNKSE
ncbi:MAG: hypothetical protein M3Q77_09830 [Thermoproteota archaeon]|nr:hypothetical protein [Thermoproteota archaeon]